MNRKDPSSRKKKVSSSRKGRNVCSKKTVNFLRRMAKRKKISYEEAVVRFYGHPISSLNKNLVVMLGVHDGLFR
jgi:hypothetical protein